MTLAELARAGCSPCTRCHRDLIQGTFPCQGFLLNLGGLGGLPSHHLPRTSALETLKPSRREKRAGRCKINRQLK